MTKIVKVSDIIDVRTGKAVLLIAVLAVQPICTFAASWSSHPDPVGEKVYNAGQLGRLVPIAIIIGVFSLVWLIDKLRRKGRKISPDHAEPHHS